MIRKIGKVFMFAAAGYVWWVWRKWNPLWW